MRPAKPRLPSTISALAVFAVLQSVALGCSSAAQENGNASAGLSALDCPASDGNFIAIAVQATDERGRPIAGLEESDFRLFDNNRPQKILAFRAVDSAHPPAIPLKVEIILDAVNSSTLLFVQERDGLSAFLKQHAKLSYSTSIWILENTGLTKITGPSQDGAALLATLNGAKASLPVISRSAGGWGDLERIERGIQVLRKSILPDARTPGRKVMLFLSPGWPVLGHFEVADQRGSIFDDIVKISNGLRESCIALDTLDSSSFDTLDMREGRNPAEYYDFLKPVQKSSDSRYGNLSLQVLSAHSGGQVVIDSNNIGEAIATALRGAGTWYNLVFERAPGGRTTEYHAIRVTIDQPHVKAHTTAGYYVTAP